jgi:hypothetical protein
MPEMSQEVFGKSSLGRQLDKHDRFIRECEADLFLNAVIDLLPEGSLFDILASAMLSEVEWGLGVETEDN